MEEAPARDNDRLRPGRRLSWRKKLMFAALTTLLFFAMLELALAVLQVDPVTRAGDPFVGFSRRVPLFEESVDDEGKRWMRTAPGKLVWFNPQSFLKEKPPGTRRVFCVGGSTTFGRPFADSTSFCGWLREFLPRTDPNVNWEVINAGGVSYASYRVAVVMEELARYEPDLFIVLSAHNEFLERRTYASMFEQDSVGREVNSWLQSSRTWSLVCEVVGRSGPMEVNSKTVLPEEVDEILNHSAGPKEYRRDIQWSEQVYRHYEWNLQRMIKIAREAGSEIVLLTPASNLRDCAPFKSEYSGTLREDDAAAAREDRIRTGVKELLEEGEFEQALGLAEGSVGADSQYAENHYLLGRARFGLERWQAAEQAFRQAIEEDVCPLRATSRITETVRRVAKDQRAMLVDFEAKLADLSLQQGGHCCFGGEYFLDHVHPTIGIHRQLAIWILETLHDAGWMEGELPSDAVVAEVRERVESSLSIEDQGVAFRNLAKVLHWAGKFQEAIPRAQDAIRLLPGDLESRFVLADCYYQTGKLDSARDQYRALFERGDYSRAYLPYGELLMDQGAYQEAKPYLMGAILSDREEHRARAYYDLGMVHLQLGEYDFAVESLRACDRLFPNDAATLALIAEAEWARGNVEIARKELRRVTEIDPDNFYAHYRLAEMLMDQKRLEEARPHFEAALRLEPVNEMTRSLRTRWERLHQKPGP